MTGTTNGILRYSAFGGKGTGNAVSFRTFCGYMEQKTVQGMNF